jgi:hypothetical protein
MINNRMTWWNKGIGLGLLLGLAAAGNAPALADDAGGPVKDGHGRAIANGNNNQLVMYGIVTRALLYADDGGQHQLLNVDGSVENTRIGFIASGAVNADTNVIGHVEMNTPLSNPVGNVNLSGTESSNNPAWTIRIQEIAVDHKRYGKLTLGQGNTASTDRVVVDLSGSGLAAGNNPADMAGGIQFVNTTTKSFSATIGDVFDKIDGIDKDDRVRYDLPEFAGFNLGVSHTDGGAWDVGGGYAAEIGTVKLQAAAFYANVAAASTTRKDMWGGSGSIKHKSGLSLTMAGAIRNQKAATLDSPQYLWGKIGYSAGLVSAGGTHFGLSYGEYKNFAQNGDKATETGIGIVQDFDSIGSNVWLLVRNHTLDRTDSNNYDDIFIASLGVLLNF